jgi:hypothetical protein
MAALPDFCLAALVLLSLPLPLYAAARLRPIPPARRPHLGAVWAGQAGLAAAGLLVIAGGAYPVASVAAGAAGCVLGGWVFRGQCPPPENIRPG